MHPFGVLLIVATTLFPAVQLLSLPDIADRAPLFSQYLGMASLVLMSWGQILATRLPGTEVVFGGLDRIYVLHKWAGITAMVTALLHDTIDAEMRGQVSETALNEVAEALGEISLYGLLILVALSVATFIPYHLWKWTHKLMGILFAAGALHFAFILKPFAMSDPAGLFTGAFCLAGIMSYIWTLLPGSIRPAYTYRISGISQTGGAVAIEMTPQTRVLRPRPGQFGMLSFVGAGLPEQHPFSFSSAGPDGKLRVTVKPLGDFTTALPHRIAPGQSVKIQGPFGRFCPSERSRQVWIAGGIGVTPFLTWARNMQATDRAVDFFVCARSRDQVPHLDELEALARDRANLTLHLMIPAEGNRLSAATIARIVAKDMRKVRVSFCGPVSLRETLKTGLRRYGVGPRRFHYEVFEFRSGLGLRKFASWLLERRRDQKIRRSLATR